jgi:ribulose-phosphate 3-epimerase
MKHLPIVPAVIPKDQAEVINFANKLRFSPEFHLDLIDGKFVSSICWPYEPSGEAVSVKSKLDVYTLEVDLMIENPIEAANEWIEAGADMLVFHVETIGLEQFKNFANKVRKVSLGVSAHGETTLETLAEYAKEADYIQLMGIREIGAQGLPFDEEVINKIAWLKERFPLLSITVDGSVNEHTIKRLAEAGADRFICGSAIVGQPDPEKAHAELSKLINS